MFDLLEHETSLITVYYQLFQNIEVFKRHHADNGAKFVSLEMLILATQKVFILNWHGFYKMKG